MNNLLKFCGSLLLLISLSACQEKEGEEPLVPDITNIEASNAPIKSYALNKYLLNVQANYSSDYSSDITEFVSWNVSDTQSGVMSATTANQYLANAKAGTPTITFEYKGISGSVDIENIALREMNVSLAESNITVNSSYQCDLNATYEDNVSSQDIDYVTPLINQVLWESNDTSVATVDSDALVTTKRAGSVRITARAFENYTIEKNGANEVNSSIEIIINENNISL